MYRVSSLFIILCIAFGLLSAAGCGSNPPQTAIPFTPTIAAQPTSPPKPTALPTQTSLPPSATPEPETITFLAVLDEGECTFTGPAEVPVGNILVSFDNGGDLSISPWVNHYLEGKTHEDFIRDIYPGPEEPHDKPDWVEYPFYFTKDHQVWTISLKEAGEYGLFVGSYTPWREYPCGAFRAVD